MLGRWLWCPHCLYVRWTGYMTDDRHCPSSGQVLQEIEPQDVAVAAWLLGGDAAVIDLVRQREAA